LKSSYKILRGTAFLLVIVALLFCQACNLNKYIPPKKYLLHHVKIEGAPSAEKDQLNSLLKQNPNKKVFFFFKVYMWNYLLSNTDKAKAERQVKIIKLKEELSAQKDQLAKTDPNDKKLFTKLENKIVKTQNRITHYENLEEDRKKTVWEEPVILDSQLIVASAVQFKDYLFNKGYFHDSIYYSIKMRGKKAWVTYHIIPGRQYFLNKIDYYIFDKHISDIVTKDSSKCLLKHGQKYDGDLMKDERNRLAMLLKQNGYYNFRRDYIYFDIDTALANNMVNVGIGIANPTSITRHRIFKIGQVFVESEYTLNDTTVKDTFMFGGMHFISNRPRVRPSILQDFIFIHTGDLYNGNDYQATINRLTQLNTFKFIDIQYQADTFGKIDTGVLNVFIRLTPFKKQEYDYGIDLNSTEESQADITNTRSLGTAGNLLYRNRNIAASALQLEIKPTGSINIPISVFQKASAIDTPSYQYGVLASLIAPELLVPWKLSETEKKKTAQTSFNVGYIVESSQYFKRNTGTTNLTWQQNLRPNIIFSVTPVELSLVNTGYVNSYFQKQVDSTHNPLLINLFDQHLITDFRMALLFNQQPLTNVKHPYWYLRISLETGGNAPALVNRLLYNNQKDSGAVTNKIFGINYYQYSKAEFDFRYYQPVGKENNFAFRGILGMGTPNSLMGLFYPSTKSEILPFEKQFYVGGANDIRAWKLRTLGPGSYEDPSGTLNYDKSGDIKLEANAEYRTPIYSILKGAAFIDAGNVWLFNDDPGRPGAAFQWHTFYKEIAIGGGLGARLDFNFFVVRLDFAEPFNDPSQPENHRWVFNNLINDKGYLGPHLQINLGIGYPF